MTVQKALITDFPLSGEGGSTHTPYQHFDGENMPDDVASGSGSYANTIEWLNGQPVTVAGVYGNATKFNGNSLIYHNWEYPDVSKFTLSLWVKFTPEDISGWRILATNRGDGFSNKGFHLAQYNGQLNARMYGDDGSLNLYSDGTLGQPNLRLVADQWYHICLVYDPEQTYDFQVFVNGERWLFSNIGFTISPFERSFTIGDMDGGYPFHSTIDEVMVFTGDQSFSETDIQNYYSRISTGHFFDNKTESGSLRLGRMASGSYSTTPVPWYAPIVDLGGIGHFVDYGRIEVDSDLPAGTSLTIYTRTSVDGVNYEDWLPLGPDGKITSANSRYVQTRVDFETSGAETPVLYELRMFEELNPIVPVDFPDTLVRSKDPLTLYRDLDTGLDSMGTLKNAYDLMIEEEVNGEDTLTFKLPVKDRKRLEIGAEPVEMIANIAERYYIVKEIKDTRDAEGNLYTDFICEARWTELRDWYVDGIEVVEVDARTAMERVFSSIFREDSDPEFDWTVGNVEITKKRTLRSEWKDVLSLLHDIQNTWGGELLFDTKNKIVHLVQKIGQDAGIRFEYSKNLKTVERNVDTYDLVTRIYPRGKGELDIRTVNNGVPYLQNTAWVDQLHLRKKIVPYRWTDERYTIPENLKEDAQAMLDEMAKPNVQYSTTVHDLSALTGHEHEYFELGDTVTVVDKDLFGTEFVSRIMRRKQDVRRPENTEVELAQPAKTLADIQSRALDQQIETLTGSSPISQTDVQEMTVFNHLLNSRADDGINANWVKIGTDFDIANVGFSGNWSFKVAPDFGRENSLTQTVEGVSHRSSYTVSALVATEGAITRGSAEDAFVGIKVVVHYQDGGDPDVFYLAVPDVTNNGGGQSG